MLKLDSGSDNTLSITGGDCIVQTGAIRKVSHSQCIWLDSRLSHFVEFRTGEIILNLFLGTEPPAEHIWFQAFKNVRHFAFNPATCALRPSFRALWNDLTSTFMTTLKTTKLCHYGKTALYCSHNFRFCIQ